MTRDQAVAVARDFALARGWTWLDPVQAERYRPWWVGAARWRVRSHDGQIGINVRIVIDDQSGEVVKANFIPR